MFHFGYCGTSFYNHHCNLCTKMLTASIMDPTDKQYMQDGVDYAYYMYNIFFHIMNVYVHKNHKNVLTYEMTLLILHKKWNLLKAETLTLLTKCNAVDNLVGDSQIKLEWNRRVKTNKFLYLSKLLIGTLYILEFYWWYLVAKDFVFCHLLLSHSFLYTTVASNVFCQTKVESAFLLLPIKYYADNHFQLHLPHQILVDEEPSYHLSPKKTILLPVFKVFCCA